MRFTPKEPYDAPLCQLYLLAPEQSMLRGSTKDLEEYEDM